jgi:channel protein (hemolysin III family)
MMDYSFCGFSDPVSSLSHFAGAAVCAVAAIPLWRSLRGHRLERISVAIFCFACVFLLCMSAIYHLLPAHSGARDVFQRIDHAAIFVLIAGTFTPLHAMALRGIWRWAPLISIWVIAVTGIVLKSIFFTEIPDSVGTLMYLGMGWLGAFSGVMIWLRHGFELVSGILKGSLFYTVGTMFELFNAPTVIPGIVGAHELFHFAVLFGVGFHWQTVRKLASRIAKTVNPQPAAGI